MLTRLHRNARFTFLVIAATLWLASPTMARDRDDVVFAKRAKATLPGAGDAKNTAQKTLYDRLGGEAAITAVVGEFLRKCAQDPTIKRRFEGANLPRLQAKLIEQLVAASGGPAAYTGLDMRTAHAGMNITNAEFDALVKNLVVTLNEFKVPKREQNEILSVLEPMRADVVEKKSTTPKKKESDVERRLARIEASIAAIQRRLDEAPPQGLSAPTSTAPVTQPVTEPTSSSDAPTTPAQSFAFTGAEVNFAQILIERFEKGRAAARQPISEDAEQLLNAPLAQTRFLGADGQVVDLKKYQGQKPVVLVIMRGFAGTVCVNCSAQLVAMSRRREEFNQRGAVVLVVYPGESSTVPAFLDATRSIAGNFTLPFTLLLDVNLTAVRTFNIEGSLAKPSTLILDKSGIVRYAYVGQQPGDRPTVDAMLAELDKVK